MMYDIRVDIRNGVRTLFKNPGFTGVAVLTLALGIGSVSAVFSVVYSLLWRPLPFYEPDRLVALCETSSRGSRISVSYPNFMDWRQENQVFEAMAAHRPTSFNLTGTDRPERLVANQVSAALLPMLGIEPIIGRHFLEKDDTLGAEPVALLSYGMWQRRFGGDSGVVGESLFLDGVAYTVIGVTPPGFMYPPAPYDPDIDIYVTLGPFSQFWREQRGNHPAITVTARLRPGVTQEQARADMARVARQLAETYPKTNAGQSVLVEGVQESQTRNIRPALLVLLVAVGLVLLIACANVANLLLARASTRVRDMAVRTALGAGRARLIRQLLVESVLQAILGGSLGLLFAVWGVDLLGLLIPANAPLLYHQVGVDGTVLGFTFILSVLTGVVFGLVPALGSSRPDLGESLKEGGRGASGDRRGRRIRSALVVAEVSLALVLLVCTSLMLKSFVRVLAESPGFDSSDVLTVIVAIPHEKYPEPNRQSAFFAELEKRIDSLPGTQSVGLTDPLLWGSDYNFIIEDRPAPPPGSEWTTDGLVVNPGYFDTMGIPLLRGRLFSDADRYDAPRVAVIDRNLAETYWPGDDAIGKRVKLSHDPSSSRPWLEIVGVVGHVKNLGVDRESQPAIYRPYLQEPESYMTVLVKTASNPEAMAAAVRGEVMKLDPDQPIFRIRTLDKVVSGWMMPRRVSSVLIALFSTMALVMAAVGIYSVMAYAISRRRPEIGIRIAMGAGAQEIRLWVLGHAARLAVTGVLVGLPAAVLVTRFSRAFPSVSMHATLGPSRASPSS